MKTTKQIKTHVILFFLTFCSGYNLFAQPAWLLGGNPAVGFNAVTPANNIIGTNFSFFPPAQPLNVRTNGFNRIFVADGFGLPANGFVGIGNAFFSNLTPPQSRLHLHQTGANFIYTQWTNGSTGAGSNAVGLRIGITGTGIAEIRQQQNLAMNFFTNNIQHMNILANGFVGIGNIFTPNNLLDVDGGDIDVNTTTRGYMINDNYVLRHKGNINNIFVGVNAGTNNTGTENAFVGFDAGTNNLGGSRNVCMGWQAGHLNTSGTDNTFVGFCSTGGAPFGNTTGNHNSYFGEKAGFYSNGDSCTFIGANSGFNNMTGVNNSFLGWNAGSSNSGSPTVGKNNTYIGGHSMSVFVTGNTATNFTNSSTLGAYTATFGNNSTAIGYKAIATSNDKMILGNDSVWVGIGLSADGTPFFGPGNSLEINARVNGTGAIITNASGLRFRQLTSNSPVVANPGVGILALNASGDVIYVPCCTAGGGAFGNCPTPTVLSTDAGVNLNDNNLYFSNGALPTNALDNSIGIGYSCTQPLGAKLDILRPFVSVVAPNPTGLRIINSDIAFPGAFSGIATGISVTVNGTNRTNTGGNFTASNATTNVGGRFITNVSANTNHGAEFFASNAISTTAVQAQALGNSSTVTNIGVLGTALLATGTNNNYGGFFAASGNVGINYGLYAESLPAPGNGNGPNYAGYFNGDVVFTGYFGPPSDQMFKQNITTINDALGIINQLAPKSFFYDTTGFQNIAFSSQKQYGLIAQQVEPILPEVINTAIHPAVYDSLGNVITPAITYKSINYNAFIAFLLKGMQEQQSQIDSLMNQNIRISNNTQTAQQEIEKIKLTLPDAPVLGDARPNPNSGYAEIPYYLPEGITNAKIIFIDMLGRTMQEKNLAPGYGVIGIDTSDLPNGTYTYTMVVNSTTLATKSMIRTK